MPSGRGEMAGGREGVGVGVAAFARVKEAGIGDRGFVAGRLSGRGDGASTSSFCELRAIAFGPLVESLRSAQADIHGSFRAADGNSWIPRPSLGMTI
jgi:hypothetical protein